MVRGRPPDDPDVERLARRHLAPLQAPFDPIGIGSVIRHRQRVSASPTHAPQVVPDFRRWRTYRALGGRTASDQAHSERGCGAGADRGDDPGGCRAASHGSCRTGVRGVRFLPTRAVGRRSAGAWRRCGLWSAPGGRLPRARTGGGSCARRGPAAAVAPPSGVPEEAGRVRELSIVVVEDAAQREIWHALMAAEHPRGGRPLVGCQLRYLVGSAHGWLGAAGVAASALQLAARDHWIGWDAARRRAHLHRVVGLSRFLIRPGVQCRQLGLACTGAGAAPPGGGLRGALRLRAVLGGDVCGRGAFGRQCAGGQLAAAGRDGGPWPRGPQQRGGARAQAGVCLRTGARVAATAGCRRRRGPGERPAGARGWSGDRRLGAERVRRGAAGRRPAQHPAGRDDRTDGRQPDGVAAGRGQGGPGEDQGLLPVRGPARRGGDDAAQHPAPAPRAHAAPDARGADGAVHPRRHGPELRDASGLRGSGRDRHQPDRRADLGPASAFDAGGDPERPAAGRAERPVRRAAAEGSGPQRWAQQGAGGAQERALDRGLPGLRSWPGSSGPAGWCA